MFRRVFTIFLVFFSFLPPSSLVNGSICLSQFPTAIPNNYFPSEFAEMLASHLFLFPTALRCPSAKIQNISVVKTCLVIVNIKDIRQDNQSTKI